VTVELDEGPMPGPIELAHVGQTMEAAGNDCPRGGARLPARETISLQPWILEGAGRFIFRPACPQTDLQASDFWSMSEVCAPAPVGAIGPDAWGTTRCGSRSGVAIRARRLPADHQSKRGGGQTSRPLGQTRTAGASRHRSHERPRGSQDRPINGRRVMYGARQIENLA
jgi:hypothetical protein